MPTVSTYTIDDRWVLTAERADPDAGTTHTHSFVLKNYVGCDVDGTLINTLKDGKAKESYSDTWPVPTVTEDGILTWTHPVTNKVTETKISEFVENIHGHFGMEDGDLKPPTSMNDALKQMKVVFTPPTNPELTSGSTVVRANTKEGMTQKYYAKYAHEKTGSYFRTYDVVAQAALYKISSDSNAPIQDIDVAVMEARADKYIGSYIGRDASLNLVAGHASIFDFKVGIAASTGIGIKDGAVEAKLLGCGFSLGKRVELSIFGTGFGVNLGRLALQK